MRTLDQYLDLARARQGIDSDRQLGTLIGRTQSAVTQFRCGRAWPADETMVRIAELAGVDPIEALLDLNAWRSDGNVRDVYVQMMRKVIGRAAAIVIAISIGSAIVPATVNASGTANASGIVNASGTEQPECRVQCILWELWRRLRRRAERINTFVYQRLAGGTSSGCALTV